MASLEPKLFVPKSEQTQILKITHASTQITREAQRTMALYYIEVVGVVNKFISF
jgi:hypothetical protein